MTSEVKLDHDIYFEPKSVRDIIVSYCGTRFHLHKYVLAKESGYFRSLLETEPTTEDVGIVIPPDALGRAISIEQLHILFQILYSKESSSFIPSPERVHDVKQQVVDVSWSALIHLARHFRVTVLEQDLKVKWSEFLRSNFTDGLLITFLNIHLQYEWDVKHLTTIIVDNWYRIKDHKNFSVAEWKSIPITVREEMLEKVISGSKPRPRHYLQPGVLQKIVCSCGFTSEHITDVTQHVKDLGEV